MTDATLDPEVIRVVQEINSELPLLKDSPELIHYDDSSISVDLIIDYEICNRKHFYYALRIAYSKYEYTLSLLLKQAKGYVVLHTTETHFDLSKLSEEIVREIQTMSNECINSLITEDELDIYTSPVSTYPTVTNTSNYSHTNRDLDDYSDFWDSYAGSSLYGAYGGGYGTFYSQQREPVDESLIELMASELKFDRKTDIQPSDT